MDTVLLIFNVIFGVWLWAANRHVNGLLGGYGKGVWAETYGGYLCEAREDRWRAFWFFFVLSALNIGIHFFGL